MSSFKKFCLSIINNSKCYYNKFSRKLLRMIKIKKDLYKSKKDLYKSKKLNLSQIIVYSFNQIELSIKNIPIQYKVKNISCETRESRIIRIWNRLENAKEPMNIVMRNRFINWLMMFLIELNIINRTKKSIDYSHDSFCYQLHQTVLLMDNILEKASDEFISKLKHNDVIMWYTSTAMYMNHILHDISYTYNNMMQYAELIIDGIDYYNQIRPIRNEQIILIQQSQDKNISRHVRMRCQTKYYNNRHILKSITGPISKHYLKNANSKVIWILLNDIHKYTNMSQDAPSIEEFGYMYGGCIPSGYIRTHFNWFYRNNSQPRVIYQHEMKVY
jgi:hypothetical protein